MQMSGIERIEMMGNLTASIVSHIGDTFLTVRSEAELSAGNLSTTGQWPAALGAGGPAVQLQGSLQQMHCKEQCRGEGASFSSVHHRRVQTKPWRLTPGPLVRRKVYNLVRYQGNISTHVSSKLISPFASCVHCSF